MARSKPQIGVTCAARGPLPFDIGQVIAVRAMGGRPVLLSARRPRLKEQLDGLVVSSGTHVHPRHYGGEPIDGYDYDIERDELELEWLDKAQREDIPILAVCRGVQLLNVSRGGTLHPDVATVFGRHHYPGPGVWPALSFRKPVEIKRDTQLAHVTGRDAISANALNIQAIEDVGQDLTVSAREVNGVVQGVEDPQRNFLLGVQFHPEFLLHRTEFRNIYRGLVQAARGETITSTQR